MYKYLIIFAVALYLVACTHAPIAPSASVSVASANTQAQLAVTSRSLDTAVASNSVGIKTVTGMLPDSPEKKAITFFNDSTFKLVGYPPQVTYDATESIALKMLSTELASRETAYAEASKRDIANAKLLEEKEALVAKYKQALQDERDAAKRKDDEWRAEVERARSEAEAKQRALITWIFFGGSGLCITVGVVVLVFAGSVPMFGPKAAFSCIGAGIGLFLLGILYNELSKHPMIVYIGSGLSLFLLGAAIIFMIANHQHDKEQIKAS